MNAAPLDDIRSPIVTNRLKTDKNGRYAALGRPGLYYRD